MLTCIDVGNVILRNSVLLDLDISLQIYGKRRSICLSLGVVAQLYYRTSVTARSTYVSGSNLLRTVDSDTSNLTNLALKYDVIVVLISGDKISILSTVLPG